VSSIRERKRAILDVIFDVSRFHNYYPRQSTVRARVHRQRLLVLVCTSGLLSLPRINFMEEFSVQTRGTFLVSSGMYDTNRVKRASHDNRGCDSCFL